MTATPKVPSGFLCVVLAAGLLAGGTARADDRFWSSPAGGAFEDAGNWGGDAPPSVGDAAVFDLVSAGYVVQFASSRTCDYLFVLNDGVELALNGNLWTLQAPVASVVVGQFDGDVADLTVTNGTLAGAEMLIADHFNAIGTLVVGAGGSVVQGSIRIGTYGDGAAEVTGGGMVAAGRLTVGVFDYSIGYLTVLDAGSGVDCGGDLTVGDLGQAYVTVANGAIANVGGRTTVAANAASDGFLTVQDGGSRLDIHGDLTVGEDGWATLDVLDGGSVSSAAGQVAQGVTSRAAANVAGAGSRWELSDRLTVGASGEGMLTVSEGGQVAGATAGVVGSSAGGLGLAKVLDAGSLWSIEGDLTVGEADGASGALRVEDGGAVTCLSAHVGRAGAAWGDLVVSGLDATLTCQNELNVGFSGMGGLTVSLGAAVQCGGSGHVGRDAGSQGEAFVTGAGAAWQMDGDLRCGDLGTGSLSVSGGGYVRFNWGTLGGGADANGTLMVTGPGSCVEAGSRIAVGWEGIGTLAVDDGGLLRCTDLDVALGDSGVGQVLAIGEGSRIEASGGIYVGGGVGWGVLFVADGATVEAPREVQVRSGSQIDLDGGTVRTHNIWLDGGELYGCGRADAWVHGNGPITAAGGTLTIGSDAGPNVQVTGSTYVADDATLEVVSPGRARIGGQVTLTNGVLIAGNGVEMDVLAGYGVVVGEAVAAARPIDSPPAPVRLTVGLDLAGLDAAVYSLGVADLGPITKLSGGRLYVVDPSGVEALRLAEGDVLEGPGQVDADVRLQNAVIDAGGGTLAITGGPGRHLSGYGVLVGDVWADAFDIAAPTGTVELAGELHLADRWAKVFSLGEARLGDITTLEGGGIQSPSGLALPAGALLMGHGRIEAPFYAERGSMIVATGDLEIGGWFAFAGFWTQGLLEVGPHRLTLASFGPAYLDGVTIVDGGTIVALSCIEMGNLAELHGAGRIEGSIDLQNGLIQAADGGTIEIARSLSGCGIIIGDVLARDWTIAYHPSGQVRVEGEDGFDLNIGAQVATIYTNATAILDCRVYLAGGTLECDKGIRFGSDAAGGGAGAPAANGGTEAPAIEGFGTVAAAVSGAVDIYAAGGRLSIGDAARADGVDLAGGRVYVAADAALELLDADDAQFAVEEIHLDGGVLIARGGAALGPMTLLWGHGVIVGEVLGGLPAIRHPSQPVRLTVPLDVGAQRAVVHSAGEAALRDVQLGGGTLAACQPLRFAGGTLSGFGGVEANVFLQNASILAAEGRTITIWGDVGGFGVIAGDVRAETWGIEDPQGTVELTDRLDVGGRIATVYSQAPAGLARTRLDGGTLECAQGFRLRSAARLDGHGTVLGGLYGEPGSVIQAEDGDLHLGQPQATAAFATDGVLEVGAERIFIHSAAPAALGARTALRGGSLIAPAGVALGAGDTLEGWGAIDAPVAAAAGSSIAALGSLALGADVVHGFHDDGEMHVAHYAVELRDRNQAVLGSLTTLGDEGGGGSLAAANGSLLDRGRDLIGHGDVTGDFENQGYVLGEPPGLTFHDRVSGSGEFDGEIIFAGTLSPGDSPAVVRFGGSVTFTSTARLEIELAESGNSDPARPRYDALDVAGNVSLSGALGLTWLPRAGEPACRFGGAYDVIVYGGDLGGAFEAGGELAAYFAGINYAADLGGQTKAVRVELYGLLDGDADLSGRVAREDFLALRGAFGAADAKWAEGDFDFDGDVDAFDYVVLKRNCGVSVPGPASVPEPAALCPLAAGALLCLRGRRPAGPRAADRG
jgi:T5SS/PEP-CTERM-associated repeat protein